MVGAQPDADLHRHGFRRRRRACALRTLPLDAIPDLSDTQVIVYTEYPGQAPQVVEDQVTYPLTSADADGAALEGGARLLVLRRLVRLRHLRGWGRHLLGALARPRISQRRRQAPAGWHHGPCSAQTPRASAGSINMPSSPRR
ncbi:efflux RND transporter permease subunit [Methylocystis parvus]|uniref:efflux RND transporter permease subunit n=1 Tax=Methylocystis parvus TaxID=134 RepID=UPI003C716F82